MKKLITDQLIEEYQKELEEKKFKIKVPKLEVDDYYELLGQVNLLECIISRLQSLREQEVQNVLTAYRAGEVVCHLYDDSNDYFTQTFEQK